MKTYTTTVQKPRLVIWNDDGENPREWSNIGYFFTNEGRFRSPDGTEHGLYEIMAETADEAENTEDHIKLMEQRAKAEGYNVRAIFPIVRYEHGNVVYRLGTARGFDYSNCGFYFVMTDKSDDVKTKDLTSVVDSELATYTQWVNGEVYGYTLYDENGNIAESCGGFYNIGDIRECLLEEWKNEKLEDYIKN